MSEEKTLDRPAKPAFLVGAVMGSLTLKVNGCHDCPFLNTSLGGKSYTRKRLQVRCNAQKKKGESCTQYRPDGMYFFLPTCPLKVNEVVVKPIPNYP